MSSFQIFTSLKSSPLTSKSNLYKVSPGPRFLCCTNTINFQDKLASSSSKTSTPEQKIKNDKEDEVDISGIHVPRQKYIPVSKAELLDSLMLMQQEDGDGESSVNEFMILSSCLDAILHAEHKSVLEDMRNDFAQTQVRDEVEEKVEMREGGNIGLSDADELAKVQSFDYELEDMLRNLLSGSSNKSLKGSSKFQSRIAVASRFQRAFVKLLRDAQFEELSVRDLKLTSALNTDYLLTLPIYVDWKKASESNAIIFRRGYATERQKGLLIVEKLDYLQSRLLQIIFFTISKPLGRVGLWINEAVKSTCQKPEVQAWVKRLKPWIKELSAFQLSDSDDESSNNLLEVHRLANSELPIWLAAQKAIPRYEGLLSSAGPRGRLLRRLLTWTGLVTPIVETTSELSEDNVPSEPYLRPTFLSRKSLSDIWRPASRKSCRNDLWKMLKTSFSILLSKSILQEPAFQELILLYTKDLSEGENKEDVEIPSLELKIFERIPIPDLPVIFPNKKLSFRIIDTVRLDIASILGLLAYLINYKFENISSSPSAVVLDVVAITALIIYVFRVALGYKQTWDRYQLLVNRTLYEKTLASGFGSVHFLIDASEQQQYKEAILAYAILLKSKEQVSSHTSVRDQCEKFLYEMFKEKVEMPIEKAIHTLVRLGLVTETISGGKILIQALPRSEACNALKKRWNSLLN